ncbi:polyphosphate kinase 1 [Ginsengibacter hankyongi]|uniref:Polyphosphate kinase n=1 Tax=Ginsengibacter hankyongi TaxID=2607284 RepID=A0A5J5IJS7_9BACT|nr:polyphosphate kinase 1 [Ginsengibacter hankyongi]KAA9040653.1 polyphosphate kinase 1 [Ginsengibacter hankyongi]
MMYNRDLSWLGFNLRVLQEAADADVPLYERLKFLSIFSSNLDEFFRVRYPEVIALSLLGKKTRKEIHESDKNVVEKIQDEINRQLDFFGSILHNEILPSLKQNGIIFYYNETIRIEHLPEIREIFLSNILSFIQPIYLDGKSEKGFMPENNKLYLVITLEDINGTLKQAIVNIPSEKTKRFFTLTPLDGFDYVIFLDDIVRENLVFIFPGLKIIGVYSIKLNRDAEIHLEDDYRGNLLKKIEGRLKKRDFGLPSRFLFQKGMPLNLQMFLISAFNITNDDMFPGGRYHNLKDLSNFPDFNKHLCYQKRKPLSSSHVMNSGDIFDILPGDDILLHLPYQSYNPVLSFFNQAAVDINVSDIYITLYRVAEESHIINALISAAKNGKNVVVFIELKARFDEANNIRWSRIMKDAGIKLIYSPALIKVHSKIALVRKKKDGIKQSFAVLSTGNFNEITAQFYTDHVLMTADKQIIKELRRLFKYLQLDHHFNKAKDIEFKSLLVSRFNMKEELKNLIDKEIDKAKQGEDALIRIKVNNLEEPGFINQLYKAGKAGVKINLIVRSICCLVPGIPGESENIVVKRIVDRYLEHSRILIFGTKENAEVIMGSADLMTRNLYYRIEADVRIKNENCKKELIKYFTKQWDDNDKAVMLLANFQQEKINVGNAEKINAQQSIYNFLETRQ